MRAIRPFATCLAIAWFVSLTHVASAEVKFDSATFGGMEARSIGPATMSGRIAALDAVMEDRLIVYVGAATGGVWKSTNGGTNFKPVFDDHTQSIGAIAIDRSNPDVVWVGTGEAWTRNSVSVGTGIYKTTDAGETWEHVGLEATERMSKILLDPRDDDTAYVCVTGHLWDAHEDRGVYKTRDGGQTWERILYVDADTGCGDLAMDPQEPDQLIASTWQFRRYPYFFESGGPGSGIYRSSDGGANWHKVEKGLPAGDLGRIALAVAPSRPSRVYATVECQKTAMYVSDDHGESWRRAGTNAAVEGRPFYFSLLVPDPQDHTMIYKPGLFTARSTDGGETFSGLAGSAHSDHHALWINPADPQHILLGTDGGLYISHDRGANFNFVQSLPLSQFYQVGHDMQDPYNVFGGLQDNGSWRGPSRAAGGVKNKHWDNVGFGDGFHVYVDRGDDDILYVEWQGGRVQRHRQSTGETKNIQPLPIDGDSRLRFNWNAPIHLSPNRPDTLYIGAQYLFRSRDRGESWSRISPDLTTNDPDKQQQMESGGLTTDNSTAENHCTIYTISESPIDGDIIWVGTDDGNLQVTRDGGDSWTDVSGNLPGVPACTWVTEVEAGRHDPATCHVTLDGHRTGDRGVYVYRTTDFGETWAPLATEDVEGYALVIRQDLVDPNLLFLGTEFGLYITLDGGTHWARFKENLPKVGVRDLVVHPREHDLIIGTHGRGVYIIDDLTPLRQLSGAQLGQKVVMLGSRPSQVRIPANIQSFPGDDEFIGGNPPSGASISYYLNKRHIFGDLKIEILDADGDVLLSVPGGKRRGINRVFWSMRGKGPTVPPAASLVPNFFAFMGPTVAEGTYRVRLVKGKNTQEGEVRVVGDPRAGYSAEGKALQDRTVTQLYDMLGRLTYVVDALLDLQAKLEAAKGSDDAGSDHADIDLAVDALETFRKRLVATRKGGFLAGEEQLREKLGSLYGAVNGFEGRPTDSQVSYLGVLEVQLARAEQDLNTLFAEQVTPLNDRLGERAVELMSRDAWQAGQDPAGPSNAMPGMVAHLFTPQGMLRF